MKTKISQTGLLLIFTVISINISAAFPDLKKNDKSRVLITGVKEFMENKWDFENRLIESEILIEDWMTKEFSGSIENNYNILPYQVIEDWMTDSDNFTGHLNLVDTEPEIESWMYEIIKQVK